MELLMISSAFAQSAAGGAGGFSLQGLLPFILIFIIFYFLLIRPQQKRVKQHKLMVESLKRGNKVLTAGGILGVCLLYTSPSPRDRQKSRMPSSA